MSNNNQNENDSRYPYTYSCDLIRSWVGYNEKGNMKICRSEASIIRSHIADVLDIEDQKLAKKLADYYLENEKQITENNVNQFIQNFKNN